MSNNKKTGNLVRPPYVKPPSDKNNKPGGNVNPPPYAHSDNPQPEPTPEQKQTQQSAPTKDNPAPNGYYPGVNQDAIDKGKAGTYYREQLGSRAQDARSFQRAQEQVQRDKVTKQVIQDLNESAKRSGSTNEYEYNENTGQITTKRQVAVQHGEEAILINKNQKIQNQEQNTNPDVSTNTNNNNNSISPVSSVPNNGSPIKEETQAKSPLSYLYKQEQKREFREQVITAAEDFFLKVPRSERPIINAAIDLGTKNPEIPLVSPAERAVANFLVDTGEATIALPFEAAKDVDKALAYTRAQATPETRQLAQEERARAKKEVQKETPQLVEQAVVIAGVGMTDNLHLNKPNPTNKQPINLAADTKTVTDLQTGATKDTTTIKGRIEKNGKTFEVTGVSEAETQQLSKQEGNKVNAVKIEQGVVNVRETRTGKTVTIPVRSDVLIKGNKAQGKYVYQVPEGKRIETVQGSVQTVSQPTNNAGEIYTTTPEQFFEQNTNTKNDAQLKNYLKEKNIERFGFEKEKARAQQEQNYLRQQKTIAPNIDYNSILKEAGVRKAEYTLFQKGTKTLSAATIEETTNKIPKGEMNYFTKEEYEAPLGKKVFSKPIAVQTGEGEGFVLQDNTKAAQIQTQPTPSLTKIKPTIRETFNAVKNLFQKPKPKLSTVAETKTVDLIEFDSTGFNKQGSFANKQEGLGLPGDYENEFGTSYEAKTKLSTSKVESKTGLNKEPKIKQPKPIDTKLLVDLTPDLKPTEGFTIVEGETVTRGNKQGQGIKTNLFTGEVQNNNEQVTIQEKQTTKENKPTTTFPVLATQAAEVAAEKIAPKKTFSPKGASLIQTNGRTVNPRMPTMTRQTASTTQYYDDTKPQKPITQVDNIFETDKEQEAKQRTFLNNPFKRNNKQEQEKKPLLQPKTITEQAQEQTPNTQQDRSPLYKPKTDEEKKQKNNPLRAIQTIVHNLENPPNGGKLIGAPLFSDETIETGYDVELRRKGKFYKINKEPLTKKEALGLGAYEAGETLAASFKIVRTNKEATGHANKTKTLGDFYKSNKENEVYVQKRNRRLNASNEVKEIQNSRRKFFA